MNANSEVPALRLEQVRFTYPKRRRQPALQALRGVDLTIPAGQTVALLGPNGSGKSTLMKIVCGLLPRQSGSVQAFGSNEPLIIRRSLGVVFQSPALDRHMTVRENLRDYAAISGVPRAQMATRIRDELARADLSDRRDGLVKTLSGGLARRVDLVRALLSQPRILMLDEPTAGLDPAARERFLQMIKRLRRERNLTVLMSTHLVDEADRFDRVVLIHEGRIVADDSPVNLRQHLGARQITVLDQSWNPPKDEAAQWRRAALGWRLHVRQNDEQAPVMAARLTEAGVPFTVAPPTLADVFESVTGARLEMASQPESEDER